MQSAKCNYLKFYKVEQMEIEQICTRSQIYSVTWLFCVFMKPHSFGGMLFGIFRLL